MHDTVCYGSGETVGNALRGVPVAPDFFLSLRNGTEAVPTSFCKPYRAPLATWQVTSLFSPPGLPSYNGSIEAGIGVAHGALKTRTHIHAARYGHPEWWTCDDIEAARLEANALTRPWGAKSPTPDQAWNQRTLLSSEQRAAFLASVKRLEQEERQTEGIPTDRDLDHYAQSAVNREAIRRALVAHGFLLFTRRSIPLPIRLKKVAKIR